MPVAVGRGVEVEIGSGVTEGLSSLREIGRGMSGSVNTTVGEDCGVELGAVVGVASRLDTLFAGPGSGGIRVNVAMARGAGVRVAVGSDVLRGGDFPEKQFAVSRAASPATAASAVANFNAIVRLKRDPYRTPAAAGTPVLEPGILKR